MNDRPSETLASSSGATADILSDVLRAVRLTGAVFFDVHASSPWVAESPASALLVDGLMPGAQHVIPFHVVTAGSCYAGPIDADKVILEAGDLIAFPHGDAHVMASDQGLRAPTSVDMYRRSEYTRLPVKVCPGPGGEVSAHVICGFLGCDARPFNPLLDTLPPVMVVRRKRTSQARWLDAFIESALAESREPTPGGECLLARLSELLFIEAVRSHVQTRQRNGKGWLAGLGDPAVSCVLGLLHGEPAQPWTLESLAQRSSLSRSVLAERFHELVGMPPMQYLARWRMQVASGLLASSAQKVATVARQVGYESEAAFSRAFKKLVGVSPAQWRRERGS